MCSAVTPAIALWYRSAGDYCLNTQAHTGAVLLRALAGNIRADSAKGVPRSMCVNIYMCPTDLNLLASIQPKTSQLHGYAISQAVKGYDAVPRIYAMHVPQMTSTTARSRVPRPTLRSGSGACGAQGRTWEWPWAACLSTRRLAPTPRMWRRTWCLLCSKPLKVPRSLSKRGRGQLSVQAARSLILFWLFITDNMASLSWMDDATRARAREKVCG